MNKMLALASVFCYDKRVFRAGCDSRPAVNLTSYFSLSRRCLVSIYFKYYLRLRRLDKSKIS